LYVHHETNTQRDEDSPELAQADRIGPWIGGFLMVVIVVVSGLVAYLGDGGGGH
jgi:hypothetical protein